MSVRSQDQLNWGTAAEVASYTGVARELIVDTTNQKLFLTDGATIGGKAVAMEAYVLAQIAVLTAGVFQNEYLFDNCE